MVTDKVASILDARATELKAVDDAIIGEVIGVAQAAGEMRKALDKLDDLLDERQFEKAAALGYEDIATAFIFLQRTLGGLISDKLNRHSFISSIAQELQCAYEDAEALVAVRLNCLKPKPEMTDEERADATARIKRYLEEI